MLVKLRINTLLLLILLFAFAYRLMVLSWNGYPPGADIGLHESVIKSITAGSGFYQNLYHMGGGVSATNPGFHIFVIAIVAMTNAPDYLVQIIVAAFFSTLIVLAAFLFVRNAWNESAALVVAVLVAFSGSDIAILTWGGYPNVITLAFVPIIFYLFIQHSRFSSGTYLLTSTLLVSSMFLTHVFSTLVFIAITVLTLLLTAIPMRRAGTLRGQATMWLVPILAGALVVSPYLQGIVPVYFGTEGAIVNPASPTKQALLETNLVSANVVYLSLIPVLLFLLLSKLHRGKFFTTKAVLSAAWIMVPAFLTQSYLLGVNVVYARFMYFLALPVIICVALMLNVGSRVLSNALTGLESRVRKGLAIKGSLKLSHSLRVSGIANTVFILLLLLPTVFFIPLFAPPSVGIAFTDSYQVMTPAGYEAIEWIGTNTAQGSICVADANLGWWVSGFSQRPTLSAVEPQYLILAREFEPARVAANVMELNHFIDNGLIRISQDDSGVAGNVAFAGWLNDSYVPYLFFSFNDTEIEFIYRNDAAPSYVSFAQIPQVNSYVENNSNSISFLTTRENSLFTIMEETTLYKGTRFAEISISLQARKDSVSFDWLHFYFQQRGSPIQYANSISATDASMHLLSQIILPEDTLGENVLMRENPNSYELVHNLQGNTRAQVQVFVGLCQYQAYDAQKQPDYLQELIYNNTQTYLAKITDLSFTFFDYKTAIQEWNISYIIARNPETVQRMTIDPLFNLVFRNKNAAIFEVKGNNK